MQHYVVCSKTVKASSYFETFCNHPGPTFIKPHQLDPWIKDQMKITLLSTVSPLHLPNFVSCGTDKPSHMTQNLVTVGTNCGQQSVSYLILDPWIKLIWVEKTGACYNARRTLLEHSQGQALVCRILFLAHLLSDITDLSICISHKKRGQCKHRDSRFRKRQHLVRVTSLQLSD